MLMDRQTDRQTDRHMVITILFSVIGGGVITLTLAAYTHTCSCDKISF